MTTYDFHEQAIKKVNDLGLTKEEVIKLTGLSNATITKFMKGKPVEGRLRYDYMYKDMREVMEDYLYAH